MNVLSMNSLPILIKQLEGKEKITRDEYNTLIKISLNKREEEKTYSTMLSNSSHILDDDNLINIRNTKLKYIDYYLNNVLGIDNKFIMTSSWLTMNQNGSSHERHSHGNVILSSVLYFCENLSDEPMSSFYISQSGLKHIFQNFQFEYKIINFNEYNSTSLTIPTKSNLLVIFPGWMLHGSEPMNSNTKRYCIGSNYFLNDHVGSGYHSLSVKTQLIDTTLN